MSYADKIFPISLSCREDGWSEYSFRSHFNAAKPVNLVWYAYDTIIHSPISVEFVVYDMADNTYGGLGKKIASLKTAVPAESTSRAIDRKIMSLAQARRAEELRAAEEAIINSYAAGIRAALSVSSPDREGK